jgi:hypothetical protein
MTTISADLMRVRQEAAHLSTEEQLQLIAYLAEQVRNKQSPSPARRKWREIRGKAPFPLLEEDAQAWVSRTRQESDAEREHRP